MDARVIHYLLPSGLGLFAVACAGQFVAVAVVVVANLSKSFINSISQHNNNSKGLRPDIWQTYCKCI